MGGALSEQQSDVLDEIERTDPAWPVIENLVDERSAAQAYNYSVSIKRIHRVRPTVVLHAFQEQASSFGEPTELFHGTTPEAAKDIVINGFKLPRRRGMFGSGIYFAKDPLKSVNYARRDDPGWFSSLTSWFYDMLSRSSARRELWLHLLLCDVYLGNIKTVRRARPTFCSDDLRRGWLMKKLGFKDFNSLRAASGCCGAVRVEEFVVYQEHQCIPRFLIEFDTGPVPQRSRRSVSYSSASAPTTPLTESRPSRSRSIP
jgi:hypothetical protein|eukprot:TRINITY_DN58310_c0_g1_i1.p1 TRINITY_DN58310_c0_g1~~TRINITY_DN58310_c0_g1_i1.p1  ORF type:complete len:259 (+),score=23.03 TRINITY_DN58310_c0_g1_i1:158-934(+)